jgi:cell division transport system permease protein
MMTRQNRHLQKPITPIKKSISPRTKKIAGNFLDKFRAYLALHAQTLFFSLGKLLITPLTSIMTIIVLAISIALATSFYLLLANIEQLTGDLEASNQISLFLKTDITNLEGRKLADKLKQSNDVKWVDLITREAALAEFKDYSGFGRALDRLESNPLPTVLQVLPKNTLNSREAMQRLVAELEQLDEVDIAQMDMQWVQRLQSMMDLAQQGVILLNGVLMFAVLFIMGNSIRLELEDSREQVLIEKLVGATEAFIQRPFLYTGFWFGFFSGIIAWIIVSLMMLTLKAPMERLSELYDKNYQVLFLSASESLILLLVSSLLGILGAGVVLRYQLEQMKLV